MRDARRLKARRGDGSVAIAAGVLALGLVLASAAFSRSVEAAAPCPTPVTIACENTQPGSPESQWGVSGSGSSSIQGFATDISVNKGDRVNFKVKTSARSYRLDIYRMGYYGGSGARVVGTVLPSVVP